MIPYLLISLLWSAFYLVLGVVVGYPFVYWRDHR